MQPCLLRLRLGADETRVVGRAVVGDERRRESDADRLDDSAVDDGAVDSASRWHGAVRRVRRTERHSDRPAHVVQHHVRQFHLLKESFKSWNFR